MNEYPIAITNLNDFIFCPVSIYFHNLEFDTERLQYQDEYQINGTAKHNKSDNAVYSTKKSVLQGVSVYCEKYNLIGKIDIFDESSGILTERKKRIVNVYDGYIFQIYAQFFALTEMGYMVDSLRLYSMDDNKVYPIKKPLDDVLMFQKFEKTINDIRTFEMKSFIQQNKLKCQKCIYEPLCSYSNEKR